jgi:hypothetical protein
MRTEGRVSRAALLIAALSGSALALACSDPMPTFVFDAAHAPAGDAHSEAGGSPGGPDGGAGAAGNTDAGDGP